MSADEYSRLVTAFKQTEGYRIYWQVHSLIASHSIFAGNHKELHAKLTEYTDPKVSSRLFDQGKFSEAQAELRELTRLVHNYVASVKTLVDHTRVIANKVIASEKLGEYQERVDSEFKFDPTSRFLHNLRDYLLHVSHPPIKAKLSFTGPAGMESGVELASDILLTWENWSSEARKYINSHLGGIAMLPLVDEYNCKVQSFYEWLVDYLYDARRAEMDEFWAKQDEWAEFCNKNGIPTSESEFSEFVKRPTA